MKNVYQAFVLLIIFNIQTYCQIDPLGDVFLNAQPIWSHVAIDSSSIGYKDRTGMDYFSGLCEYKILVVRNSAYLVYVNSFEGGSGSFLEKIDLATGKSIWSNFIDLRNSLKREYTKRFFINEEGELELLNLRQSADTLITGIGWLTGKLAIHKYDTLNGREIYINYSPVNDTNYLEFSLDYKATLSKNDNHGYECYTTWFSPIRNSLGLSKIEMDSLGKFISINGTAEIFSKFRYRYAYEDIPFFINETNDSLVRVSHSFKNYPYISGDSLEILIHLFNHDLNEIANFEISSKVTKVKEYQIIPQKGSFLSIRSTEYFQDNSAPRRRIITVNSNGEVVEEIYFHNRMLNRYGDFDAVLKLRNEPGSLIIMRNKISDDPRQFNFYKSDGKGNMALVLEVPLKNTYNIYSSKLEQLEDGNILLSGKYRRKDVDPSYINLTERFITTLWDAKKLQINVATKNKEAELKIHIYPNPTIDYFEITGIEDKLADGYLYDESGKLILQYHSMARGSKYNIKKLLPGKYFIQIVDDNNQLLFIGTIIKL